jgi:2-polyprenyl-3-methyl-5-hydroxy-6-metoxy-1,4-benzoquinol methylase
MTSLTAQPSGRPENLSTDYKNKELEWCELFSVVESDICWVQPPRVLRILRRNYVRDILKTSGQGKRVLEFDYRDGWLSLLTAQNGVKKVTGMDFSPKQIELARNKARGSGLDNLLRFICQSATEHIKGGEEYGTVAVHGFLYHLSASQI